MKNMSWLHCGIFCKTQLCSILGSSSKTSAVLVPESMIRGSSSTANHRTRSSLLGQKVSSGRLTHMQDFHCAKDIVGCDHSRLFPLCRGYGLGS